MAHYLYLLGKDLVGRDVDDSEGFDEDFRRYVPESAKDGEKKSA